MSTKLFISKSLKCVAGMITVFCVTAFLACCFIAPALAEDPAPVPLNKHADIRTMCGTKPTMVALIDGYGLDTWRRTTWAELNDEAAKCPNVKKLLYAEAGGDRQKWESDVNSMVAQGVNIIICFTDFGDSMIPAFRRAYKAGVTVIPYFNKISGTPGKDYTALVYVDPFSVGGMEGDWMGRAIKTGNVVYLGGPAGALSSVRFLDGFKAGINKYPGIKLLDKNYIVCNWNPADGQKAVAGLIAKYPKIDGIGSDYGVTTLAAVKAFHQAGLPVPAMATMASNNELNGLYLADKKAGKPWQYLGLDGTTSVVRFALRRGLAAYQGTTNNEPLGTTYYPWADSLTGLDPKYDPSAPPDADLSSMLPEEKLNAVFKR